VFLRVTNVVLLCSAAQHKISAAELNDNNNTASTTTSIGSNAIVVENDIDVENAKVPRFGVLGGSKSEFEQYLTHPLIINHQEWTSATAGYNVSGNLIDLYRATAITDAPKLANKMTGFVYFAADIVLRFVVQGQSFAAGKIVAYAVPRPKIPQPELSNVPLVMTIGKVNTMIVPHVEIDPSKVETLELRLPCLTMTGCYAFSSALVKTGSWELGFEVINPIISGTATAGSMTVCTYMHFENPRFEGLTALALSNNYEQEKEPNGTLSTFVNGLSRASGAFVGAVPFIDPAVSLFSTVTGGLGSILSILGFSKPPAVENFPVVLNRFGDNYTQFEGKSTSMVLAGSAKTSLGLSGSFSGADLGDMSIANLCKKRGLVDINTIAQAAAAGSLVDTYEINPMKMRQQLSDIYEPTPMSGVSRVFRYWAGDIKLTLEVVATVFHRGTLLLAWDPNGGTAPDLDNATSSLHNVIIPVTGNSTTEITIPWKQGASMKTLTAGKTYPDDNNNGKAYLYVINPIKANGSTDGVYVNMYYSSDNIRFNYPDPQLIAGDWWPATAVPLSNAATKVSFGESSNFKNFSSRLFGEDYVSIKQLTSKLTLNTLLAFTVPVGNDGTACGANIPVQPILHFDKSTASAGNVITNNFSTYFRSAFLGYRGGTRVTAHAYVTKGLMTKEHYWFERIYYNGVAGDYNVTDPGHWRTVQYLLGDVHIERSAANGYAWMNSCRNVCPNVDAVLPMLYGLDYFYTHGVVEKPTEWMRIALPLQDYAIETEFTMTIANGTADDGVFVYFLGFPPATMGNQPA
jgi:hypothetical protein